MKKYKQIKLKQTCIACPEQYDAFFEGEKVGYLRLRHGYFYAEYGTAIVYEAEPFGDGMFEDSERKYHLKKARKAIYKAMIENTKTL